jgi:hypothetical protein
MRAMAREIEGGGLVRRQHAVIIHEMDEVAGRSEPARRAAALINGVGVIVSKKFADSTVWPASEAARAAKPPRESWSLGWQSA